MDMADSSLSTTSEGMAPPQLTAFYFSSNLIDVSSGSANLTINAEIIDESALDQTPQRDRPIL
jgi:hypothetical protein